MPHGLEQDPWCRVFGRVKIIYDFRRILLRAIPTRDGVPISGEPSLGKTLAFG